jgi:hypothetical protein
MMPDETKNQNLEVMRSSDAEAAGDPLGEIHEKLETLINEVRSLRAEIAASRE